MKNLVLNQQLYNVKKGMKEIYVIHVGRPMVHGIIEIPPLLVNNAKIKILLRLRL